MGKATGWVAKDDCSDGPDLKNIKSEDELRMQRYLKKSQCPHAYNLELLPCDPRFRIWGIIVFQNSRDSQQTAAKLRNNLTKIELRT